MCKLENCFSILCCHAWIRFRMRIWFNFSSRHVLVPLCPTLHHRMSHTSARYILFIEFKRYLFASVVCFVALLCVCDCVCTMLFSNSLFFLLSSVFGIDWSRNMVNTVRCLPCLLLSVVFVSTFVLCLCTPLPNRLQTTISFLRCWNNSAKP